MSGVIVAKGELINMRSARMTRNALMQRAPVRGVSGGGIEGTPISDGIARLRARKVKTSRQQLRVVKRRVAPSAVGKRLVDEEKHTSPFRAAGYFSGMGALAWGGSRLKYVGPGLRAGKEMFEPFRPRVARVLNEAERIRRGTERATDPLGRITGRGIGRMPKSLRDSLEKVPQDLRPATATLAGAILVHQSSPVRRTTYRPVGDS